LIGTSLRPSESSRRTALARKPGRHLLTLSSSQFDPELT
jgi:hypothetical protein